MEFFFSTIFYLIILLTLLIIIFKNIDYYRFIFLSIFIRLIAILFNLSLFPLPDSRGDAFNFETKAWFWALSGPNTVLSEIVTNTHGFSWTYAKIISLIYLFVGRDYLLILTFNLLATVFIIHFLIKISKELNFSNLRCKILLLLFSLFPAFINYASVSLREIYIHLLITMIIYFIIKWIKKFEIKYFFMLLFLLYLNNFLHEGVFVGVLLLIILQISYFIFINKDSILKPVLFILSFMMLIPFFYKSIPYSDMAFKDLPKAFQGMPQCERVAGCEDDKQSLLSALNSKVKITHVGATSYPNYLIPNSPIETLYLSPLRMIYFYIGPHPWDIKKISHLYLLLDSSIYLFLFLIISLNYKYILNNKIFLYLILFFVFYSFIFSFGTSNYGSAYRHRAKFAIFLFIFVTPIIENYFLNILPKIRKIYLNKT